MRMKHVLKAFTYISVVISCLATTAMAGNLGATLRERAKRKKAKSVVIFGVPLREINERGLSLSIETRGPASTASTLSAPRRQIVLALHDNQDEEAHEETVHEPDSDSVADKDALDDEDAADYDDAESQADEDRTQEEDDDTTESWLPQLGPLNFEEVALQGIAQARGSVL